VLERIVQANRDLQALCRPVDRRQRALDVVGIRRAGAQEELAAAAAQGRAGFEKGCRDGSTCSTVRCRSGMISRACCAFEAGIEALKSTARTKRTRLQRFMAVL
jgi:hypothetical protein